MDLPLIVKWVNKDELLKMYPKSYNLELSKKQIGIIIKALYELDDFTDYPECVEVQYLYKLLNELIKE